MEQMILSTYLLTTSLEFVSLSELMLSSCLTMLSSCSLLDALKVDQDVRGLAWLFAFIVNINFTAAYMIIQLSCSSSGILIILELLLYIDPQKLNKESCHVPPLQPPKPNLPSLNVSCT